MALPHFPAKQNARPCDQQWNRPIHERIGCRRVWVGRHHCRATSENAARRDRDEPSNPPQIAIDGEKYAADHAKQGTDQSKYEDVFGMDMLNAGCSAAEMHEAETVSRNWNHGAKKKSQQDAAGNKPEAHACMDVVRFLLRHLSALTLERQSR